MLWSDWRGNSLIPHLGELFGKSEQLVFYAFVIWRRRAAAPDGLQVPCSQLRSVLGVMPRCFANASWESLY